ncbi:hypothetical protein R1sor_017647 [Riccia sorocarpa]|uniref:RanBP2-type domain-containing protein n=1 Tax=Riccia sorocarpa TaxID=122646 RepID=A0ABD3IB07_9MARC
MLAEEEVAVIMRGGGGLSSGYDGGSRGSRDSFGFGSSYNSGSGGVGARQFKSGDWICGRSGCGEHNFASRMECYRCSAQRESGRFRVDCSLTDSAQLWVLLVM